MNQESQTPMSDEVETKTSSVQFLQFHRPGLSAGDYEIAVKQMVKIDGRSAVNPFEAMQNFTIAGERFELKPTDVHSVYPPDGNIGGHSNVLPHIILNRSTLPWERIAENEIFRGSELPCLALLLFDEDEKPKSKTLTLADLGEAGPEKFKPQPLILESAQHTKDVVTVIDVPASRLEAIMPSAEELPMLAHARFGTDRAGKSNGEEWAVIISNRLPQPGKTCFAYLVSVEGRFANDAGKYRFDYERAAANDLIRLVSLKSWSFVCESESSEKGFKQLLLDLNKAVSAPATLRLPLGTPAAEKLLQRGYVLLPHYFRHGDQTASWFHGPLIPGSNTSRRIKLPARTVDELVRYDTDLAMFDVSYAAAWELGRLLALQDKDFSIRLYQWKRQEAQGRAQAKQFLAHLPFQKVTSTDMPEEVSAWFDSLRKLEGIPFNYLVPEERMLPTESIRFFRVDDAWVDCLADGALSIGRVSSSDHAADASLAEEIPALGLGEPLTGFLLRSELVSGWPGLLVDAYADRDKHQRLAVMRMERLDTGVLLCIFKGQIERVEIYQQPETLHFGFERKGSVLYKELRNPDTGASLNKGTVNMEWRSATHRTVNVTKLAQSLREELKLATFKSSHFALQMIEGVEKVTFLAP